MRQAKRIVDWVFLAAAAVMVLLPPFYVDPQIGKTLAVYESGLVREIVGSRYDPETGHYFPVMRDFDPTPGIKYGSLAVELLRPRPRGAVGVGDALAYRRLAIQLVGLIAVWFVVRAIVATRLKRSSTDVSDIATVAASS